MLSTRTKFQPTVEVASKFPKRTCFTWVRLLVQKVFGKHAVFQLNITYWRRESIYWVEYVHILTFCCNIATMSNTPKYPTKPTKWWVWWRWRPRQSALDSQGNKPKAKRLESHRTNSSFRHFRHSEKTSSDWPADEESCYSCFSARRCIILKERKSERRAIRLMRCRRIASDWNADYDVRRSEVSPDLKRVWEYTIAEGKFR